MATPPAVLLALAALVLAACSGGGDPDEDAYPPHRDVTATVFWVGEPPSEDNDEIANDESYWDADWEEHFGGFDDPDHRTPDGGRPAAFTPEENPFYFALPYGELADDDTVKPDVTRVPWYRGQRIGRDRSILKNRWIEVSLGPRTVYAQWQDVGPFGEDDPDYGRWPRPGRRSCSPSTRTACCARARSRRWPGTSPIRGWARSPGRSRSATGTGC